MRYETTACDCSACKKNDFLSSWNESTRKQSKRQRNSRSIRALKELGVRYTMNETQDETSKRITVKR